MRRMCGRCVKDGVVSTHSQKVCDPVSGEVVCAPRRRVGNSGPLPLPAPNSGNPPLVGLVCGATSTRAALVLVAPHKARWCGATLPRTTFACAWCVARSTCQGLVRCGGLHRGGGSCSTPLPMALGTCRRGGSGWRAWERCPLHACKRAPAATSLRGSCAWHGAGARTGSTRGAARPPLSWPLTAPC